MQVPLLIAGDLNDVLVLNERMGHSQRRNSDCFKNCIQECLLEDIKATGCFFTWNNKQKGERRVWAKLDHVMGNQKWQDAFESTKAFFMPEGCFDHSPILITTFKAASMKRKPFRYFKMWSLLPNFKEKLKENWEPKTRGVPMFLLVTKLKRLKGLLKQMNRKEFANIQVAAEQAKAEMVRVQEELHKDPLNKELIYKESLSRNRYIFLQKAYVSFLSQKAKLAWVRGGDENTSIFHAFLKVRHKHNTINSVRDATGNWMGNSEGVIEAFLSYYKQLLGSTMIGRRSVIKKIVLLGPRLTAEQRQLLQEEYRKQEFRDVVFNIP